MSGRAKTEQRQAVNECLCRAWTVFGLDSGVIVGMSSRAGVTFTSVADSLLV